MICWITYWDLHYASSPLDLRSSPFPQQPYQARHLLSRRPLSRRFPLRSPHRCSVSSPKIFIKDRRKCVQIVSTAVKLTYKLPCSGR